MYRVVGGLIAGSLAVATDATHMASDLAGFLISLVAIWLSSKPATRRLSFGFYRAGAILYVYKHAPQLSFKHPVLVIHHR